jgi:hypothetical protein
MCRSIKTLFNFERKLSGFNAPSKINEAAFNRAVDDVAAAARKLLGSLVTLAPPKDREKETEKAKERARARLASR